MALIPYLLFHFVATNLSRSTQIKIKILLNTLIPIALWYIYALYNASFTFLRIFFLSFILFVCVFTHNTFMDRFDVIIAFYMVLIMVLRFFLIFFYMFMLLMLQIFGKAMNIIIKTKKLRNLNDNPIKIHNIFLCVILFSLFRGFFLF